MHDDIINQAREILTQRLYRTDTLASPQDTASYLALKLNAAAIICSHNPPSGYAEPSVQDKAITLNIQKAMELIDIRLVDHIVVGGGQTLSFAERGWL
ncbi:hypothetical protein GW721_11950 [Citrobacter braakii]|jgi:DNA repair protein RadC|nr:hypothetical protein [Citrobacter braakii]